MLDACVAVFDVSLDPSAAAPEGQGGVAEAEASEGSGRWRGVRGGPGT